MIALLQRVSAVRDRHASHPPFAGEGGLDVPNAQHALPIARVRAGEILLSIAHAVAVGQDGQNRVAAETVLTALHGFLLVDAGFAAAGPAGAGLVAWSNHREATQAGSPGIIASAGGTEVVPRRHGCRQATR